MQAPLSLYLQDSSVHSNIKIVTKIHHTGFLYMHSITQKHFPLSWLILLETYFSNPIKHHKQAKEKLAGAWNCRMTLDIFFSVCRPVHQHASVIRVPFYLGVKFGAGLQCETCSVGLHSCLHQCKCVIISRTNLKFKIRQNIIFSETLPWRLQSISPKMIGILTKVFCTFPPSLYRSWVIVQTILCLSFRWIDWHTYREAMIIPEGQLASGKNSHISLRRINHSIVLLQDTDTTSVMDVSTCSWLTMRLPGYYESLEVDTISSTLKQHW